MVVETLGTYVNIDGRAQQVRPAKAIRAINRTLMMAMSKSRQDRHGTPFDRWHNEENKVDCFPGWVSIPAIAERLGHELAYKGPKQIMAEIAETNEACRGRSEEHTSELQSRCQHVW